MARRRLRPLCRSAPIVAVCLAVLVVAACTPTARTAGPYAAKGRKAARVVHSSIASDLLLIQAVERGNTITTYVSVATSEAEGAGSEAISTFLAIQPPDADSERLRDDLSDLFNFADDALGQVRIAGRRGDIETLRASVPALQQIDAELSKAGDGEPFDTEQLGSSKSDSEQSASESSGGG